MLPVGRKMIYQKTGRPKTVLFFANNLPGNLGLIDTHLDVHCPTGAAPGKLPWPCPNLRLTNNCALAMDVLQVVGISEETKRL